MAEVAKLKKTTMSGKRSPKQSVYGRHPHKLCHSLKITHFCIVVKNEYLKYTISNASQLVGFCRIKKRPQWVGRLVTNKKFMGDINYDISYGFSPKPPLLQDSLSRFFSTAKFSMMGICFCFSNQETLEPLLLLVEEEGAQGEVWGKFIRYSRASSLSLPFSAPQNFLRWVSCFRVANEETGRGSG